MIELEDLKIRVTALEDKPRIRYYLISAEALDWIAARCDRKSIIQAVTFLSSIIALFWNPLQLPDTKPVLPTLVAPIIEEVSKDALP